LQELKPNVRVEENKILLRVNKSFYDFETVENVKKQFEQIADVLTIDTKTDTLIEITPIQKLKSEEMEIIGYEFFNRLLNTIKEMRNE